MDIFGRYGGEEFSILLLETHESTALKVAKRLLETVSIPMIFDKVTLPVTISIGMASLKKQTVSMVELLQGLTSHWIKQTKLDETASVSRKHKVSSEFNFFL